MLGLHQYHRVLLDEERPTFRFRQLMMSGSEASLTRGMEWVMYTAAGAGLLSGAPRPMPLRDAIVAGHRGGRPGMTGLSAGRAGRPALPGAADGPKARR